MFYHSWCEVGKESGCCVPLRQIGSGQITLNQVKSYQFFYSYVIVEDIFKAIFRSVTDLGNPFPNCLQFYVTLDQNLNPHIRPTQCTAARIIYWYDEQIDE